MNEKTGGEILYRSQSGKDLLLPPLEFGESIALLRADSGSFLLHLGAETVEAESGMLIFIPHGTVAFATAENTASLSFLSFPLASLAANMEKIDLELFDMLQLQTRARAYCMTPDSPQYGEINTVFTHAETEYGAKETGYRLSLRADICRITAFLLRHYCEQRKEDDRLLYHNVARFSESLSFAQSNMAQKLTVPALSAMMHLSPDYFSKMLFESTGKTAVKYLQAIRINAAMRILLETEQSVEAVAAAVGYTKAESLNRLLKQHLSLSAAQFRRLGNPTE